MPVTEQDARALAHLAMRIRRETPGANTWDEHGTNAVMGKLVGRDLATTAERVVIHAADPEAKTPGAVMRPFKPKREESTTRVPPRREQECRRHPGEWSDACRICSAPKPRDADEPTPEPASNALALARAQLATTRANLCGHGTPTRNCNECSITPTKETTP